MCYNIDRKGKGETPRIQRPPAEKSREGYPVTEGEKLKSEGNKSERNRAGNALSPTR